MTKRILRMPQVQHKTGFGPSQIYSLISKGKFPKPKELSEHARGWPEEEVDAWIDALPRANIGLKEPA